MSCQSFERARLQPRRKARTKSPADFGRRIEPKIRKGTTSEVEEKPTNACGDVEERRFQRRVRLVESVRALAPVVHCSSAGV